MCKKITLWKEFLTMRDEEGRESEREGEEEGRNVVYWFLLTRVVKLIVAR
jgi:hypothetical protein